MTQNAWQYPGIEQTENGCKKCTKGIITYETLGRLYRVPCDVCNKEQREIYDKKNHCDDE